MSLLKSCPIFPLQNSMIPISQYTTGDLDLVALTFLKQAADIEDIRFLFRRLGIESILGLDAAKNSATPKLTPSPSTSSQGTSPKSPISPTAITTPAIKQWRSAEQNALAWFSALENVLTAKDVSKANVGYDLEIMLKNGKCYYVEVKSVKRLGDAIRITNNEHSTAHLHGKSYLFAIVVNSDPLEIKIIQDPINTLTLEKRCEQWVWCSENYANEAVDIGDFTQEE